ncbi:Enoyl-(Acyl carrier protein) reductase [Streptosporangium subroseum]|uniref:Enoyl-(Acyl carrier protein) reductase n=1 Tax=Streptosporangium subroseum TaxID=106412 RepID=A0A239LSE3_9ACTN|nr:SDR family oxidoreductase [Streptosporangium subroseum]SNT32619.1 Enoyl-(Acyl carrier protein) reductase [Streptosporangium subroseum]
MGISRLSTDARQRRSSEMRAFPGTGLAPRGIRVNSVSPGYIETEMYRSAIDPDAETRITAEVPLGSLGHPDDVAAAVAFLASEDASYITGQDLVIDGGLVGAAPLGLRL